MSIKRLAIVGVGIGIAYHFLFGSKDDAAATPSAPTTANAGFNSDGTPRQLTDSEAENYLKNNTDLSQAFGSNLEQAKWHWINFGYRENRVIFA